MKQFLNLQKKNVDNDIDVILEKIINVYNIDNRTYVADEKNVIVPKICYLKTMQAF